MAYEIGSYVLRMRPGTQGTAVDRGTYLLVLEPRGDGSWCRTVEMFSPETPSLYGPVTADRAAKKEDH